MLDKVLEVASAFDWISPVAAWVQDLANGPSHTFLIPHACGWSGREVQRLLHRRGIKTWGLMIVNDTLMITVPLGQARHAAYLLQREGIPFEGTVPDARRRAPKGRAAQRHASTGVAGGLAEAFSDLGRELRGLFSG